MLLYCLLPALFAQEADDEFDFLKGPDAPKEKVGGDFDIYDDEEDWTAEIPPATVAPSESDISPSQLQWEGQSPLSGQLPLDLMPLGAAGWLVSLPILATLPDTTWEGGELLVQLLDGDKVISQSRHDVLPAEGQPGLILSSHHAPMLQGSLALTVSQELDGEEKAKLLFQRAVELQP